MNAVMLDLLRRAFVASDDDRRLYDSISRMRYQWAREELWKARLHRDAGRVLRMKIHLESAREYRNSARFWRRKAEL